MAFSHLHVYNDDNDDAAATDAAADDENFIKNWNSLSQKCSVHTRKETHAKRSLYEKKNGLA